MTSNFKLFILIMNKIKENIDITNLSNFKTKAKTKYYYEINNEQDLLNLKEVFKFAKDNTLKTLFIWWWTNILFAFDYYEWIIIKNNLLWWSYNKTNKILDTFSNELISNISESLNKDYWQHIFDRFIWLPWTIWWAIYWNAWCFWLEISNNLREVKVLDLSNFETKLLTKSDLNFSYRSSLLKEEKKYFIISAKFDLSYIEEKYPLWDVDIYDFRQIKQPKWNTCWSFFKNPSREFSAWFLVEKVWLKWYNRNWAYFSNKHSNFLMNDWTASYKDLLELIKIAQDKIYKEYKIKIIPEVNIIYN